MSRVQLLSSLLVNAGLLSDHELGTLAAAVAARVRMLAEPGSEQPKAEPVLVVPRAEGIQ